jgi:hypothetical protein
MSTAWSRMRRTSPRTTMSRYAFVHAPVYYSLLNHFRAELPEGGDIPTHAALFARVRTQSDASSGAGALATELRGWVSSVRGVLVTGTWPLRRHRSRPLIFVSFSTPRARSWAAPTILHRTSLHMVRSSNSGSLRGTDPRCFRPVRPHGSCGRLGLCISRRIAPEGGRDEGHVNEHCATWRASPSSGPALREV